MKLPRWSERPALLALLTLAVALVPVGFALQNYREESRLKDQQLFEATSDHVAERLQLITLRHLNFLNVLRNVLRNAPEREPSSDVVPRSLDWRTAQPHLIAFALVGQESGHAMVRWTLGNATGLAKPGDDLMMDERIAPALRQSLQNTLPIPVGVSLEDHRLFIVEALPDRNRMEKARGFVVGWIDLASLCRDATVPLLKDQVLQASPLGLNDPVPEQARAHSINEGDVHCRIAIMRGPQFQQRFGQVPPVLVFVACVVSAVLLALMVMQAVRAAQLRTALTAERELGQMRSQFVSSVSHEFRTPLSIILSGADLLETHAAQLTAERREEIIARIKDSTHRMNEMVEQVLLLGHIESGTLVAQPRELDLAALCRDIAGEVSAATHERCPIVVEAMAGSHAVDPALLRSILGNLLSNAVKYSPAGSQVKLEVAARDTTLSFIVRDEGIGIPTDDLRRVNEPFHRGGNVTAVSGTGLGLAIVERCVKLHGGTLHIESQENAGTTATVMIPRA